MSQAVGSKPVHFLLVEDDDDHAILIERSLQRTRIECEVNRVHDGVEALEFLQQQGNFALKRHPDIILLDLNLPRLNGHEVLSAIRSDPNLCHLPVVVLTTSDADADREKAYQHHANSYLVKPADFSQFRKFADDLCDYWGV